MNLMDQLDWSYWKRLNAQDKRTLLSQVLLYFVNPLLRISDVQLREFELYGIKCETFELMIDEELFVFVPGNKDAILGWNLGAKGLSLLETTTETPQVNIPAELSRVYDLQNMASLEAYIDDHTSNLRKAAISPMFVQCEALPAGTNYLGIYDTVTGEFEGQVAEFSQYEQEIREILSPNLTPEESLNWSFPPHALKESQWYIEIAPASDRYFVYSHESHTYASLRKKVRRRNFDLLTEDQWEYMNGAGSRRLFRWGNELNTADPYRGKGLQKMIRGQNMFGLVIDTCQTRFELTDEPSVMKLTDEKLETGIPVVDFLPLSSYYTSDHGVTQDERLRPEKYLYRKAIIVKV